MRSHPFLISDQETVPASCSQKAWVQERGSRNVGDSGRGSLSLSPLRIHLQNKWLPVPRALGFAAL